MDGNMLEWADRLKALRDRKAELEAELKDINARIDDADWHLSNLMAESETQNFTHAGTMFCLTTKTRASAKAGRKDDLFEALDLQAPLQSRYTGGTVFHAFIGERISDPKLTADLVKRIATNYRIPYFTLTPTFSICPVHGYIPGEHESCPLEQ